MSRTSIETKIQATAKRKKVNIPRDRRDLVINFMSTFTLSHNLDIFNCIEGW